MNSETSAVYARLFVAAPDLLDACEAALEHLQEHGKTWERVPIMTLLENVIRKAKGED